MKKILAILMAFAMIFSLAACANESSDDKKEKAVSEDEAIFEAAETFYDSILSGDGKKIKNSMASVFSTLIEKENPFADFSDEEAALFAQFYGIDISSPDAVFEILAISVLEEFGDVASINVDNVNYEKLSKEEIEEKNQEYREEGINDYKITDAVKADVDITVALEDGEEIETTQKLFFVDEGEAWKVILDEE